MHPASSTVPFGGSSPMARSMSNMRYKFNKSQNIVVDNQNLKATMINSFINIPEAKILKSELKQVGKDIKSAISLDYKSLSDIHSSTELKEFTKIIDKVLMDKPPRPHISNSKSQANMPRLKIPKPKKNPQDHLPVVVPGPFMQLDRIPQQRLPAYIPPPPRIYSSQNALRQYSPTKIFDDKEKDESKQKEEPTQNPVLLRQTFA